jgi:hypothetical protein
MRQSSSKHVKGTFRIFASSFQNRRTVHRVIRKVFYYEAFSFFEEVFITRATYMHPIHLNVCIPIAT